MFRTLSHRLLPLLQVTRMALVFTAISNAQASLLLRTAADADRAGGHWTYPQILDYKNVFAIAVVSIGLYGFGMSLNDIIDRRRDLQLAANRPIPSGRLNLLTAQIICALLAVSAFLAGLYYARQNPAGHQSLLLLLFTALFIVAYDLAGKYLVAPGLLALGLIRFFHAMIPAPHPPILFQPLLLLNHVTLISLVAYKWEEKRPALTPIHWTFIIAGLIAVDALTLSLFIHRSPLPLQQALNLRPTLLAIPIASLLFIIIAFLIRKKSSSPRAAGQRLMLYGLLWLIVYDALFVAIYVGILAASILFLLLPLAYGSVILMRWWANLVLTLQRPNFRRA